MAFVSPQGYQPVYNPPIPYRQQIYGGLRPGMSVYIQGMIPHHVNRFHVNFSCGGDVAFHFNPRFDGKDKVVFNTLQNGSWGAEEKKKDKFPFHKGRHFELVFLVNPGCFQVNVNGAHFYNYNHRIPIERVDSVQVEGDVTLQSLSLVGGGGGGPMMTPGFPSAGVMPLPGYPAMNLPAMGGPTYNPTVPYRANIPGGVSPKRTFVIRGFMPLGSQRFHINFRTVSGDIAFHFNVRLNECTVVRNSQLGGSWGAEERGMTNNPFVPGQYFDISVRTGNGRYKVFVNGQPFCEYGHRFPALQMINTLEVEGDVVLSLVQF